MSVEEWVIACAALAIAGFALGRISTRITWFHARMEEKYTVPEFVRGRQGAGLPDGEIAPFARRRSRAE
ncbi:MAG: hypothetical protein IRZ10_08920 [Thermoflavifilum sp.]|nr:hypothetical protein [Thermoflavifilum sp.]MCL6514532.1 hypothetical protein [Alicyclobacillus sp.]